MGKILGLDIQSLASQNDSFCTSATQCMCDTHTHVSDPDSGLYSVQYKIGKTFYNINTVILLDGLANLVLNKVKRMDCEL